MPYSALDYLTGKQSADIRWPPVRLELVAETRTRPGILYYLASDSRPEIRFEMSNNPATARKADRPLAKDEDVKVRGNLARKIAQIAPILTEVAPEAVS